MNIVLFVKSISNKTPSSLYRSGLFVPITLPTAAYPPVDAGPLALKPLAVKSAKFTHCPFCIPPLDWI